MPGVVATSGSTACVAVLVQAAYGASAPNTSPRQASRRCAAMR
jgi:hypothetical protein